MGVDCSASGGGIRAAAKATRPLKFERRAQWCVEADAALSQTYGHDHDLIVQGVNCGALELWKLWDGEAWMVTRMEAGVLTCCCYQGSHVRDAMQHMVDDAQRLGLKAIVFFTRRPGLARLLSEFKPEPQETVYRISISE
jgi:hypothetical protein